MICSRCEKDIEKGEFVVEVCQKITLFKIREDGLLTRYDNVSEETREILCEDCFHDYDQALINLNEVSEKKNALNKVKLLKEVTYDDEY